MTTKSTLFARVSSLAALFLTTVGSQPQALAADYVSMANQSTAVNSTATYWTSEALASARPLPLPEPNFAPTAAPTDGAEITQEQASVSANGKKPQGKVAPDRTNRLFDPALAPQLNDSPPIEPQDVGTVGAHYSSSRLVPLSADLSYPHVTVGKLFFTIPNQGDFVCSASVINYRILLTAGHCVHSGNGQPSGWYTNFLFVPAFRDGIAPYQAWNWRLVAVTVTWFYGGGGVPNAADYAMIELEDRVFFGVPRRIGTVTGFLGWQTLSLLPNHAHLLGYPCNIDYCQKMHQVTAGSFRFVSPFNGEYGSDMRGGSSGGPWVQNFGSPGLGQPAGGNAGLNRVIGVTSYGYISTDPKVQGSSILDNRFVDLLNFVCANRPGNCTL